MTNLDPETTPPLIVPQRNEFNQGQEPNMFIVPEDKPSFANYMKKLMALRLKLNQILRGVKHE